MAALEPNPSNSTSIGDVLCVENPKWGRQPPPMMRVVESFNKHYPSGFLRKVGAEVIATYIMVFVTCGTAALSEGGQIPKLGASMAGGLIVTVMIYAVGHISGAHMNPAVTLAFAVVRHFPWNQVPFYGAAQVTGSICASFTLKVLLDPIKQVGTTSPCGSDLQALIMETVVTFTMMFVASAVATDTKAVNYHTSICLNFFYYFINILSANSFLTVAGRRIGRPSSWCFSMHNLYPSRLSHTANIGRINEPSKDTWTSNC